MNYCLMSLSTLALLMPNSALAQGKTKKPNIIYIMSDDHASAAIGAYGSWLAKVVPTPNIDKLARQGMRSAAVWSPTPSACRAGPRFSPGQYSHKNGVYTLQDPLNPKSTTIAQLLQTLGYRTALFGKWHLVTRPARFRQLEPCCPGRASTSIRSCKPWGDKKLKEYPGYSDRRDHRHVHRLAEETRQESALLPVRSFQGAASTLGPGPALREALRGQGHPRTADLAGRFEGAGQGGAGGAWSSANT